jgi:hypothetical protein
MNLGLALLALGVFLLVLAVLYGLSLALVWWIWRD